MQNWSVSKPSLKELLLSDVDRTELVLPVRGKARRHLETLDAPLLNPFDWQA